MMITSIKTLNYNTPPLSCRGQITLSNTDQICSSAIPNQISLPSMHVPSLVKILWYLHKLSSGNENMGVSWADNSVKIWRNFPLAIPNQISTISMPIPSLVKIHWCLLKLSSGNETRTDRRTYEADVIRLFLWSFFDLFNPTTPIFLTPQCKFNPTMME